MVSIPYELNGRVEQKRRTRDALEYEVVTGMLAPDTQFAPHGHTLRLRVAVAP